ncbi:MULTISPECIES: DUF2474 family protein [Sulfitobacter]|uniref:DUF2474 domain-containing protein n=1 Tax=Sulfitobacter dubius TaxID=218673 RepID=A0ABY3ZM53_9RHOB|nr:DUF2474 family protein [Sulfitobacter dubius]UOA13793.1 hypothetical protein DSM109990_00586 [Sulfitobacter dubius]WOI27703.1 DUF2474 family protein [Sulfitobacter dubius]
MRHWLKRSGWFVALWLASVLLLAVVAYGIRLVIMPG